MWSGSAEDSTGIDMGGREVADGSGEGHLYGYPGGWRVVGFLDKTYLPGG